MKRFSRQAKILDIINHQVIETQEELTEALRGTGFVVTQATVSRDIQELNLVKVIYAPNKQRYAHSTEQNGVVGRGRELFKTSIVSFDHTGNIVVLKTVAGMANAASIFVEELNNEQVVGTVSGFNTVFVAMRDENSGKQLIRTLEQIIND
ncbi:MAG: arginine repressor [Firmicutes bacterium]|nr:arginine repressor [Bacillota bacterium]